MSTGSPGALFPKLPAEFTTGLSVHDAVSRLAQGVSPIGRSPRTSVVGHVKPQDVVLIRASRAGRGDRFITCFVGAFDTHDSQTRLRGYYGLHPRTEASMGLWFFLACGITAVAAIVVAVQWSRLHDPAQLLIPAGGLLIGAVGYGICRYAASRHEEESRWLDTFIRDCLRVVS